MNIDKAAELPGISRLLPKEEPPVAEEEIGADWMIWDLTIDPGGSATPPPTGPGGSLIATKLNWRVSRRP